MSNEYVRFPSAGSADGGSSAGFALAGSLAPASYDQIVITYVVTTTNINTFVYMLSASPVRTLTMSYDNRNRLSGVVVT